MTTVYTFRDLVADPYLMSLAKAVEFLGYEIRIVGGAVRDILLNKTPKDVDLATNAHPNVLMQALQARGWDVIPTGLQHGTITVVLNKTPYEITTLRVDKETDGRHATVEFTDDWKVDAERRDLTFNAMSMDFNGNLYDYFNGERDLMTGCVRFVGDPDKRIKEDYLRILRYYRFAAMFPSPTTVGECLIACENNVKGLEGISVERIWSEMKKILVSEHARRTLHLMVAGGIFDQLGIDYEEVDVHYWATVETTNPITKLIALVGSKVAHDLAIDWKMSTAEAEQIHNIGALSHEPLTDWEYQVSLLCNKVPAADLLEVVKLHGQGELYSKLIEETAAAEFPVNGNDLLALGFKGPAVGDLLRLMKKCWINSGLTASKEELLSHCKG